MAEGTDRVARDPAVELDAIQPGESRVAVATGPSWTTGRVTLLDRTDDAAFTSKWE